MSKPDAPTPPNPLTTAAAATGTNVATATANAFLNNTNQITPDGSLTYDQTGTYGWTDPTTGSTYQIPRFTATQQLSPQGLAIKNQTLGAQMNLAGMANAQSGSIAQLLSKQFKPTEDPNAPSGGSATNLSNLPSAQTSFNQGGPIQTSLGNYGQQQTSFDPGGQQQQSFDNTGLANQNAITGSYGPSAGQLTDFTNQVQQAMMGQISPQLDLQKQQLQQQLADQGIRYGSAAYNNAFTPFNAQENNAYLQTVTGATGQAKTLMDMAAQQAGFQNAAQQQAYNEAQGRGQFANTAQQQQYAQNQGLGNFANAAQAQNYQQMLGAGGFANAAQGQQYQQNAGQATFANAGLAQQMAQQQAAFNAAQTQRNQWMQEQYAQRNQPLNEVSSLLSGSQVQSPSWLNAPQSQIPTTDVAGIINNQFNQQLGVYQQQNQNYQSLMGGILGLGAGALKASDRRVKDVGDKIATVFAADSSTGERKELPIYKYSYKADPAARSHIGPMAQDVEKIAPEAVTETPGGVKLLRPKMVMGSILRAS